MPNEGLDRIAVTGFKSIARVDLAMGPLNVLIGSNGSGKSNFLSLFRLLNALTEEQLQSFVGKEGGANALLHYGMRRTPQLSLELRFSSEAGHNAYGARLAGVAPDALMFADETLEFVRSGQNPVRYEFAGGHRETRLPSEIVGGTAGSQTARFVKWRLDRFRSYHFHDTAASAEVKQSCGLHDNRYLRANAGNLAAFLNMLGSAHPKHYAQIREVVRLVVPGFGDFVLEPSRLDPKSILLTWREQGGDYEFTAHQLSDGSLRFICLAALLLQPFDHPNAPRVIAIDEPELGLHPQAVTLLGSMLRSASRNVQIVVSTQAASLVSAIDEPESIVVVERGDDRASVMRRLDRPSLEHWLEDYSLGDLWEKGVLCERPKP